MRAVFLALVAVSSAQAVVDCPTVITDAEWDRMTGHVWARTLRAAGFDPTGTVVEVGPGKHAKLCHGLAELKFRGRIYIVEPDPKATAFLEASYRELLPEAEVIVLTMTLAEATATTKIVGPVEALLANHPLDDMLMAVAVGKEGIANYFSGFYGVDANASRQKWKHLAENHTFVRKGKDKVLTECRDAHFKFAPRLFAISQYESYYFQRNGIFPPDILAYEMLQALRQEFPHLTEVDATLRESGQLPERWLVHRRAPN